MNSSSDNKILIVDDSKVILRMMEKYLSSQGYSITLADSAVKAAKILQKEDFLLIITDISMPNVSGLDLLLWIKNNKPESRVVVMTAFSSEEMKKFISKTGAINYIEKNGDLGHLNRTISESFAKGFSGNIKDISLFDFLNIIYLSKSTKTINIESPYSDDTGLIFFKDGEIINAEINELTGEDAFYKIMAMDSGDFYDSNEEVKSNVHHTIKTPFNFLLMNAAKIIDETKRAKAIEKLPENRKNNHKKSILIIDDCSITLSIINKLLERDKYLVTLAETIEKAKEIISISNFDLIISDIMFSSDEKGLDLLLWIRKNKPKVKVIMMTSSGGDEVHTFPIQKGDLYFFDKNNNLNNLVDLVESTLKEKNFSGKVTDINILNFIQVICVSGQSKLVCVEDHILKKQNKVFIKNGKVVHAEFEDITGEDAFYEILSIKNGKLYDLPWEKPENETIDKSLSSLLLSAFKVIYKDVFSNVDSNEIDLKVNSKAIERNILQNESLKKFKNEKDPKKQFTIYESGVVLGICTGSTKREELENIMFSKSKVINLGLRKDKVINYDDLGMKVYFDDYGVVENVSFYPKYRGKTEKGVEMGTLLHRVFEIYDEYETDTSVKGLVLKNIAFFCKSQKKVSHIKIGNFYSLLKSDLSKEQILKQVFKDDYDFDSELRVEELSGLIMGSGKNDVIRNLFSKYSKLNLNDSNQNTFIYDDFQINIISDSKGQIKGISLGESGFENDTLKEDESIIRLNIKARLGI